MVNFKSPVVAAQDFDVLRRLWLVVSGIYIWEYIMNFKYEFDVVRGHRPYRWTIWIYSLTRGATLISVILNIVDFYSQNPINCQVWLGFELVFSYVGLVCASALIIFRIFAVWHKNKFVMGLAAAVWTANFVVIIQGIVRLRSEWSPIVRSCVVLNTQDNTPNIVVTFISDVILLVIMLVGLLVLRHESGVTFPLGELLWNQGVIWLAMATVAEAPPSVFIVLNLNDSFNLMFQFPSLIVMTIASTRMYRGLSEFVFGYTATDILSNGDHRGRRKSGKPTSKLNTPASMQPGRIQVEVTVDVDSEQDNTRSSADEQLDNKLHQLKYGSVGRDLESATEDRERHGG